MQKNFYLINKTANDASFTYPGLWSSAKTYYEETGSRVDEWQWMDPWLGRHLTIEQILNYCEQAPPSVLGCSVYIWNINFMDQLSQLVKQRWPDCLIVYGGPQVDIKYTDDFFQLNPWVDIVCPSDAYGEIIIAAILEHYPIDDYEKIPYIYYADKNRSKVMSSTSIDKRSFHWPNNIFKAQESYFKDTPIDHVLYETSRGCPYRCIYCDWGGGTYTKVSKKPFHTVIDELEWIAKNKVKNINIVDANFGIMGIDVEIAKYICQFKRQYGYPLILTMEPSKNHPERNAQIIDMFLEHKLMPWYKIAIQAIDQEIKENIDRIDVSFDQQIEWYHHFKKKYPYITTKIEIIMGLPGDNYQKVLQQLNTQLDNHMPVAQSELWALLPEAPAFSPDMRKKFEIKTIQKPFVNTVIVWKEGVTPDQGVRYNSNWDTGNKVEFVVGTYSYTTPELIDMFLINNLGTAVVPVGLDRLLAFCRREHSVTSGEILDDIYKNLIKKPERFDSSELQQDFSNLLTLISSFFLDENEKYSVIDYHPDLPFRLPAHMFISFVIAINAKDFYQTVCTYLSDRYRDPRLLDLGHYLSNILLDLTYDFDRGRHFTCRFDWLTYFSGNDLGNESQYHYQVVDSNLKYATTGVHDQADWHRYRPNSILQKKQYYYKATWGMMYQSLLAENIERV